MAINKLEMKNFTVFEDIAINLSSGVNVFIGENGTGKTHLLKVLYGFCNSDIKHKKKDQLQFGSAMQKIFGIESFASCGFLCALKVWFDEIDYTFNENDLLNELINPIWGEPNYNVINRSVFIPAKDMLTHAKGLIEMAKKYSKEMPFDKTLLDVIEKSKQWKLDEIPDIAKNIIPKLEKIMGGKIIIDNDTFYVQKINGDRIEFSLEAEGIKKIGLLWQLLMNESITKDTVLLWDEPEANINPKLIPDIVEILNELSRQGVQIFIATHDYVLAKYFEIKSSDTDVIFHSLYKTDNGIKCESSGEFRNLKINPILKAFDVLMDEVIDRNLGE